MHSQALDINVGHKTLLFYFSDIKVKEPTEESLTRKVRQYMDPKFMSVKEAAEQLVQIIENKLETGQLLEKVMHYIRKA